MSDTDLSSVLGAGPWSRALVVGLGRAGTAAAALLRAGGVAVHGYDRRPQIADLPAGLVPFLGEDRIPKAAFEGIDLLVLSPGVDPRPVRGLARIHAPGAQVHGETSLAFWAMRRLWGPRPTVLVTGTNGKSTVTALTGHLMEAGGLRPFVGGNLAVPLSEELLAVERANREAPGSVVLECSSYQLETMDAVPCDVAMLLNLTPDHLARYEGMADYGRTKARIFSGLGQGGLALLSADDGWTPRLRPNSVPVTLIGDDKGPTVTADGHLRLSPGESYTRPRLAGAHNARNALFALAAARHLGVDPDSCASGLASFEGLAHRMQFVAEVGGIAYYNDSKATNVAAVKASLDGFDRPYVLIAGGQAKGDDVGELRALLGDEGCHAVVALGEAADLFLGMADRQVPSAKVGSMAEAVKFATRFARPGGAVVLSPACASWDMFRSYADRGDQFADAVRGLEAPRA